jgi:hypothetical protein
MLRADDASFSAYNVEGELRLLARDGPTHAAY